MRKIKNKNLKMLVIRSELKFTKRLKSVTSLFFITTLIAFYTYNKTLTVKHSVKNIQYKVEQIIEPFNRSNYVLEKRTYTNSPKCRNFTTRLYEEGTFPKTALISFPGSGNTWLRHLIEIATGIFTGSIYFDETLFARGFIGEREEWDAGSTLVQKIHSDYNKNQHFDRGILLIRNPVSATKAFVQYLQTGHHTGLANPKTFSKKEWPLYLLQSTYKWMKVCKSWIESPVNLLVIHYENILDSPAKEIQKICTFLQIDCFSRINNPCFQNNTSGSFHRKKPHWKLEPFLPNKTLEMIEDGVIYLNNTLITHNKEPIPLYKYT